VVLGLGTAGGDPRLVGALLGSAAPTGGDGGDFFYANKRGLKWIESNKRWGMSVIYHLVIEHSHGKWPIYRWFTY